MRRLVVVEFLSLDGVMQAPGDPFEDPEGGFAHGGWQAPYFDEALSRMTRSPPTSTRPSSTWHRGSTPGSLVLTYEPVR